jgi:KDO2-lipid IV(A) lauroyltransferase
MLYRLIRTMVLLMSYIPWPLAQFKGKGLGTVAYLIPMSRKAVALENIRLSFPRMTERDAKRLLRKVYRHFGQMLFEISHVFRMRPHNVDKYVLFEGQEHLINAMSKKKGVFILTGHFGNWELMCAAVAIRFSNTAVVARPADFAPMDRVINELRSRFGTEIIPKQKGMRRILSLVREKKIVGILLDQNVDWYEGAFVPFLGRWACANKGLALLALRTGTPVVPVFAVRQRNGRYRIIFERELELVRTGDKTTDVEENTALFTAIIESYVRRYPDHWFWFHKRWKTKNYCELPVANTMIEYST